MRRLIPAVFTGLRARLVLGFLVVTLISLALVFATLPRLLDNYFLEQAQQDLNRRTNEAGNLIALEIFRYQSSGGDAPKPLLQGDPPVPTQGLIDALGTTQGGNVLQIAQLIMQADITVEIADSKSPDDIVYQLQVPVGDEVAAPGQGREQLTSEKPSI